MNRFHEFAIRTRVAVTGFVTDRVARAGHREDGQSSAEYAGIIVVAVAIVLLLIAAADTWGQQIVTLVSEKIGELG